ncbi:MAG: type II secretion system protein [Phycisphaeraceae bacterium JB051]
MQSTQSAPTTQRGFSLIEILVVIAIIALLAGITIGVGRRMKQSAQVANTKIILNVCKSASDVYAEKFKTVLHAEPSKFHSNSADQTALRTLYIYEDNWNANKFTKNAPDASGTGAIDDHIERFVYKAMKYETSRKILKTLQKGQLADLDGDGFLEVRDAFGNMLEYAAFVRSDNYTDDNTKLPVYRHSFFASSGRDSQWSTAEGTDDQYSYDQD